MSAVDKLHDACLGGPNLRSHGLAVFDQFKDVQDGTLRYYYTISEAFSGLLPGSLADELGLVVNEIERLSRAGTPGPEIGRPASCACRGRRDLCMPVQRLRRHSGVARGRMKLGGCALRSGRCLCRKSSTRARVAGAGRAGLAGTCLPA